MIDRLELLSHYGTIRPEFFGNQRQEIEDSKNKAELEKLFNETDFNFMLKSEGFLYDNSYKLEFHGHSFIIMSGRHFKKMPTLKLVLNPNNFPASLLEELIKYYFSNFLPAKIGRIDFNIDIDAPLWNFFDGVLMKNKRKSITQRDFFKKDLETVYIGAGDFMIRIYDKFLEATQKRNDKFLVLVRNKVFDHITRIEFQLRGKHAGQDYAEFISGLVDLNFIEEVGFYQVKQVDGTLRKFGINEFMKRNGLQATYQKLDRRFRKTWLKENFKKLDVTEKIKKIIYTECMAWIGGKYEYEIQKDF